MLVRIVKMSVRREVVDDFRTLFSQGGAKVGSFQGCKGVQLLEGEYGQFFSYSLWENEESLNLYRNSDFFKATWSKLKAMFKDKPEAWSTSVLPLAPD